MCVDPEFDQLVAEAAAALFSGWDFSWLEGRRVEEGEDGWDYEERARKLVRAAASLLDLGTGGGERLSPNLARFLRLLSRRKRTDRTCRSPRGCSNHWG